MKSLELGDRDVVESFANQLPPYSDFNFTNMWSWDTDGARRLASLNGNLVVLFTDYITSERSYSFLGLSDIERTARTLLDAARADGFSKHLTLISEEAVHELHTSDLVVTEEKHNADYIFSVDELADVRGSKFKEKRHLSNRFSREHPESRFESPDIRDGAVQVDILAVLRTWVENKRIAEKEYNVEKEEQALTRLLNAARNGNLNSSRILLSCVYERERMVGFAIDEELHSGFAISHFIKADTAYRGIYEALNRFVARKLSDRGVMAWNWEQDLNIEGLRIVKRSYRPIRLLQKFSISYASDL